MDSRPVEDLISDVVYLFRHRSLLGANGAPGIAFLAKQGKGSVLKRHSLYIIDPSVQSSLVERYRDTRGTPFAVLDDRYESRICGGLHPEPKHTFYQWLLDSRAVSFMSHPQLFRAGKLTPEWAFLRDTDTVDLLTAVKLGWREYRATEKVTQALRALRVRRLDGAVQELGDLAVPTREMMEECPHLDFAYLPVSKTGMWSFLSDIGVLVAPSTTARLRELEALRRIPIEEIDREAVHQLYICLMEAKNRDHRDMRYIMPSCQSNSAH